MNPASIGKYMEAWVMTFVARSVLKAGFVTFLSVPGATVQCIVKD